MKHEMIEGFQIPVHRSLIVPKLWMGVPRKILLLLFFLGLMGGLYLHSWIVPCISCCLYFLSRYFAKKDPDFFDVLLRYLRTKSYYWPN